MLLPIIAAPMSCCLFRFDPVEWGISQGNYEREAIVTVQAIDLVTGRPISDFQVLFTYPWDNELRAVGSAGIARFTFPYPTLRYRSEGRPAGYAFFTEDLDPRYHAIQVTAVGYEKDSIRLPKFVVTKREYPPLDLPPVTIGLKRINREIDEMP